MLQSLSFVFQGLLSCVGDSFIGFSAIQFVETYASQHSQYSVKLYIIIFSQNLGYGTTKSNNLWSKTSMIFICWTWKCQANFNSIFPFVIRNHPPENRSFGDWDVQILLTFFGWNLVPAWRCALLKKGFSIPQIAPKRSNKKSVEPPKKKGSLIYFPMKSWLPKIGILRMPYENPYRNWVV